MQETMLRVNTELYKDLLSNTHLQIGIREKC